MADVSYKNSDPRPPIMQGSPPPPDQRVPAIDWDRPPWNRWSFQNIRQVLRTAPIYRNRSSLPRPLAVQDIEIGSVAFTNTDGKKQTINQLLEDTYTDGFLIIHNSKIIHESYYNNMQPHSLHLGQSVTKSVVATTAAVLVDEGLLDFNAPVTRVLPELERTAWKGATLQHVLDMTTGVRYDETYENRDSDVGKTDVACGWKPLPKDIDTTDWPDSLWEQILGLTEQALSHGERFLYRSIETEVLSFAMERVTGQRLPVIISERLWAPMGAEEDACITVDKFGCSTASGGLNASLRDYARFGFLLLNEGSVNGRQVIPRWWVDDIRQGSHGLFSDEKRHIFPNGCYRNQFWIEDNNRSAHLCLGVFGQMIYVSPEHHLVVVKLSTWPEFLNDEYHRNTLAGVRAITEFLDTAG